MGAGLNGGAILLVVLLGANSAAAQGRAIWEVQTRLRCEYANLAACSFDTSHCGPWKDHAQEMLIFDFQAGTVRFSGETVGDKIEAKHHTTADATSTDTLFAGGKLYAFRSAPVGSKRIPALAVASGGNVWLQQMTCTVG